MTVASATFGAATLGAIGAVTGAATFGVGAATFGAIVVVAGFGATFSGATPLTTTFGAIIVFTTLTGAFATVATGEAAVVKGGFPDTGAFATGVTLVSCFFSSLFFEEASFLLLFG